MNTRTAVDGRGKDNKRRERRGKEKEKRREHTRLFAIEFLDSILQN